MNIVFCIDSNYIMPCGIAMTSVLENNKSKNITIYIIGMGLQDKDCNILEQIAIKYHTEIHFFDIDKTLLDKYNFPLTGKAASKYMTLACYARLFVSDILPQDINKVLYLDCDLYVADNLDELWNTSIENYSVAGVLDPVMFIPSIGSYDRLNYGSDLPYINTGVLLINLEYWRQNNIIKDFIAFVREYQDKIVAHDQDVLNGVLHKTITLLPLRFNMQSCFYNRKVEIKFSKALNLAQFYSQLKEAREFPCIVHFTNIYKPWIKGLFHPMVKEYLRYMNLTPWGSNTRKWGNSPLKYKIKYCKRMILYTLKIKRSTYVKLNSKVK